MTPQSGSEDKVQRILDGARRVLSRNGYAAATISQVAAEAGVSRGLLHYYFKSKEDLLARVLRTQVEAGVELESYIFRECKTTEDLAAGLFDSLRKLIKADSDVFLLFFEGWAMSRQSPLVSRELKTLYREYRAGIRKGLEEAAARGVIAPKMPLDGLAAVIAGITDGLWVQIMTEPELADDESMRMAAEASLRLVLGDTV